MNTGVRNLPNDRVPYTRRPAGPKTPAPAPGAGRPPRPGRRKRPDPRRRAVALGALCVLAVALTVLIVFLAGRDRGPQAPAVPDVGQSAGAWMKNANGYYFNDAGEVILAATSKGIDVSKYQGQVDWEQARANGVEFALIRCGYGSEWNGEGEYNQDDETWEYNADECTRLGIPFGTYLYSYATTEEQARSEADHVARLLGLKAPDHEGLKDYTSKPYQLSLPVYYDLEDKAITGLFPEEMAALTAAFFDQLESYGYTGEQGIYASLNWTRARLTDPAFDAWRDNFWIARFNSTLGYTGPYTLWQASYTEPGEAYGVQSETVDIDFRMEELLITGFTDPKAAGADPSFTNDTYENVLWLPNVKDKVTLTTDEVTEESGGQRVFWTSSDENVATVNRKGVVTAKGAGSCTVTATLADGRKSADVTVRVGPVTVTVYATGGLQGTDDDGTVSLADVAALHAGDPDSILLDAGNSVQGAANTSLTGGMDMTSAFNAAGYDLQIFDAADLAYGTERLVEDAAVTSGPSLASTLQKEDGTPLFYRSTSWSRNRITNGLNYTVQRAGKTIGFFSLAQGGVYAHANDVTAEDLTRVAAEQVAALRAEGAQAIVCLTGAETRLDAAALAGLGVNAIITADPGAESGTVGGIPVLQAANGLQGVAALSLTFGADGSVTAADAGTLTAASLQSRRDSLSDEARRAYDSTAGELAALRTGDETVRAQTLFTMEENTEASRTISWGNFVAEVWLAYADGSRDDWTARAAEAGLTLAEDTPLTALAGGVTELEPGEITRGQLLDALPAGERLQLVYTTAEAVARLIDSGAVTETYTDSLVPYEAEGAALLITDTATLRTLSDQEYTVLQDYGDAFWNIRMNINDRTENFAQPFVLPEAPTFGAGRS